MRQSRFLTLPSAFIFGVVLFGVSLSVAVLSPAPVSSASAQEKPVGGMSTQERRIMELAKTTATIAGGARFCRFDPDDIEEFISKADARIVLLARDDYQKILGRLEFKNILAATSARAPASGCEKLAIQFDTILRESR